MLVTFAASKEAGRSGLIPEYIVICENGTIHASRRGSAHLSFYSNYATALTFIKCWYHRTQYWRLSTNYISRVELNRRFTERILRGNCEQNRRVLQTWFGLERFGTRDWTDERQTINWVGVRFYDTCHLWLVFFFPKVESVPLFVADL